MPQAIIYSNINVFQCITIDYDLSSIDKLQAASKLTNRRLKQAPDSSDSDIAGESQYTQCSQFAPLTQCSQLKQLQQLNESDDEQDTGYNDIGEIEEIASSDAQMTDCDILTQQQDNESDVDVNNNNRHNSNNNNGKDNNNNGTITSIKNKGKKEIDSDDSDDIEGETNWKDLPLDELEKHCKKVANNLVEKEKYLNYTQKNVCQYPILVQVVICTLINIKYTFLYVLFFS